ncbi:putative LRR receptor-like serine/threonine-protein kinase [Cinnamomum micranthum f. kanehirae]|uniref:Putative LRR receptor-like serine/threonine-protein kinase n=1 Tax=Cinnamomum micranthum f. kanehirae TaxID=337451 RepID=A0A443NI06_9MAGN|nr:putative LRR receptor-like serine/threonine-protein kinase [Cinnamomum micranthum f. kanehirae]
MKRKTQQCVAGEMRDLSRQPPAEQREDQSFISVNCGIAEDSTYTDTTDITYSSDAKYIDTGVNRNLPESSIPDRLQRLCSNLRSFPNGSRNCYNLSCYQQGHQVSLRAYFLYGDYDNLK